MKKWSLDFGLLTPVLILVVLSLTTLFSINTALFRSQLIYSIISLVAFFFFSNVQLNVLRHYSLPFYLLSFISLVILLIIGFESRGSVRWFEFFGIQVQFSEIYKPFLLLSLASFIADKQKSGGLFLRALLFLLPLAFLIYKQPDLGNALVYVGVVTLTLLMSGFSLVWYGVSLVSFLLLSPLLWQFLHDYQRQRVLTFLQPSSDPLGTSYNAVQAVIAVGSGMFLGKGLSQGTQSTLRFLPERHTDFIFATISESLGFVGGVVVILSFLFLFYRIYRIVESTQDEYTKIFCFGAFSLLLIQFFVNIGMNIGLLPIVGITLPFVSYGGSSLLSNFILLGLLQAIGKESRNNDFLEIR